MGTCVTCRTNQSMQPIFIAPSALSSVVSRCKEQPGISLFSCEIVQINIALARQAVFSSYKLVRNQFFGTRAVFKFLPSESRSRAVFISCRTQTVPDAEQSSEHEEEDELDNLDHSIAEDLEILEDEENESADPFDDIFKPLPGERSLPVAGDKKKDKGSWTSGKGGIEVDTTKLTFLVGVDTRNTNSGWSIHDSLLELGELARSAGCTVVGSTYQSLSNPNPATYIGSGKVREIRTAASTAGAKYVIFDDELSPAQLRNLEKLFGNNTKVLDRTQLILDIFAQRARTREGILQVELAQHIYLKPRLTSFLTTGAGMEARGGGKAGGVGIRGIGETQLELDRRLIGTRISRLKQEIERVRKHRQLYRNRREEVPVPVVAIVGYTNAGKSTLLNKLSGSDVFAEDKLFATLDPTTRRVQFPRSATDGSTSNGRDVLFTDTVGFIQKLPTTLIASFRATLEETQEAELLVHVVDVSHPMRDAMIKAVWKILEELEVTDKPQLLVFNKADMLSDLPEEAPQVPEGLVAQALELNMVVPDTVLISAKTGFGIPLMMQKINDILDQSLTTIEVQVPYADGSVVNSVHEQGRVLEQEYLEETIRVKARVPLPLARRLSAFRTR